MNDDQPLIERLGYSAGEAVDTVDAPEWFLEYLRGNGVHTHAKLPTEWLHMFMTSAEQLQGFLAHLKFNEIQKGLWISWPTSGSSITDQDINSIMKPYGWVETKSLRISNDWRGLLMTPIPTSQN